jgi:hypothetical protein
MILIGPVGRMQVLPGAAGPLALAIMDGLDRLVPARSAPRRLGPRA